MKKKTLSIALALVLTLALVPVALAEDVREELPDGTIYEKQLDGEGKITSEKWTFIDGRSVTKFSERIIHYQLAADEVLYVEEFLTLLGDIHIPGKTEILLRPEMGDCTIIGQVGKEYDSIVIRSNPLFQPLVVYIVDLHIIGITMQKGGTLDVTGSCRTGYVHALSSAERQLIINGTGTLTTGTIFPDGGIKINAVVEANILRTGNNDIILSSHLSIQENGLIIPGTAGNGAALLGNVIFSNANARLDLRPVAGTTVNDLTFSKANDVSGAWNVSPRSAIVSGNTADKDIVINSGGASVSVWLGEPMSDEPKEAPALDNLTKTKTYTAETFTDIGGQWYTDWVSRAYEYGIIAGVGNNKFNPTGNLSGAEALTIGAKIHSIYKYGAADGEAKIQAYKVDGGQWYDMFVLYCKAEGLIGGELDNKLTAPVTRSEMIFAWSKLLRSSDMPKQNTVNSLPDVTSATPYHDEIIYFYEAGIVSGTDSKGTFAPDNNIIRAEAATIFMRLIEANARSSGNAFGS